MVDFGKSIVERPNLAEPNPFNQQGYLIGLGSGTRAKPQL